MAKGGSKFFVGLFSFIFGFVFGIIAIVGAIAGAAIYAVTVDFETIFEIAGIENKDENGDYVYVNTGIEGISNALVLIEKLQYFAEDPANLTLGEIDSYFPVTDKIVDGIYEQISSYVEIDIEELKAVKFSALSDWLIETINDINIIPILDQFGGAESLLTNNLVSAILLGKEVKFVVNGAEEYEVYTDTYKKVEENGEITYLREGDGKVLSARVAAFLTNERELSDGTYYSLYYYNDGTGWYATTPNYDYTAHASISADWSYPEFSEEVKGSAGDYYYKDGQRVIINPVTVGTFTQGDPLAALNEVYITDLITDGTGENNKIINELLGGLSIGAVINGEVDFDKVIGKAELSILIGDVKATEAIMVYLSYGVTNVVPTANANEYIGSYTQLDEDGYAVAGATAQPCLIKTDDSGVILSIQMVEGGSDVAATTVGQINGIISEVTNALAISDFLNITDSSIMAYIGYGVSGLTEVEGKDYQLTGVIKQGELPNVTEVPVYITTQNGVITGVYSDEQLTSVVSGTKISDISYKIDGIMEDLYIRDIIDIDPDNEFMSKLGDYKISNIGDAIDEFEIGDIMDVDPESSIMAYLAYGLTGVTSVSDKPYAYVGTIDGATVYITVSEGNISGVYSDEALQTEIGGTKITSVGDRIDGITEDLYIKDIIDIDPEDEFMSKLGDYKISNIGDAIDEFEIGDILEINPESSIMAYLAYGLTGVTSVSDKPYAYVGTIDGATVYITVSEGNISGVYSDEALQTEIGGTKITSVGDRIDGITEDLYIKDIIDIDPEDEFMSKLGDYRINEIGDAIDDFEIGDIMDVDPESSIMAYLAYGLTGVTSVSDKPYNYTATLDGATVYVTADGGNVTGVYSDEALQTEVEGTKINGVGDRIDGITNELYIKDIIDIDPEDELMSKLGEYHVSNVGDAIDDLELTDVIDVDPESNIMAYLAYGLTEITSASDKPYAYVGTIDGATVYITVSEGNILGVYSDETLQTEVEGTKINGVGDRIDGITNELYIKDIIDIDPEDELMSKLGEYHVSNVGDAIDDLELTDVIDVDPESNIMAYVAYGLKQVTPVSGKAYSHTATLDGATVYVTTQDGKISGVYSDEALQTEVSGTKISGVSNRVDGIMQDLTLGEIIEIDASNKVLNSLKNATVNTLSEEITKVSVQQLYSSDIYGVDEAYVVTASNFNAEYIYYVKDENGELVAVEVEGLDKGKLAAFDTANTYYTYGKAKGTWRFMLYSDDGVESTEKLYTINDMGDLINNATSNIGTATLFDLADAGIISASSLYKADGVTPKQLTILGGSIILGDLTIAGLIDVVGSFS